MVRSDSTKGTGVACPSCRLRRAPDEREREREREREGEREKEGERDGESCKRLTRGRELQERERESERERERDSCKRQMLVNVEELLDHPASPRAPEHPGTSGRCATLAFEQYTKHSRARAAVRGARTSEERAPRLRSASSDSSVARLWCWACPGG